MLKLGVEHGVPPIPVDWAVTRVVPAGVLELALEFRNLDGEIVRQTYGDEEHGGFRGSVDIDSGWSIHVFEASTRVERLRFDCFDNDPHYHYLGPGARNLAIAFDRSANGDMFQWTLSTLRAHIDTMLAEAGAPDLPVLASELHAALDELEALGRTASAK